LSLIHNLATRALHSLDPEDAHTVTIRALKAGLGPRAPKDDPILATTLCGLDLPNCVGLAAGFDKNADVPDAMLAAGFGFAECGTVTPLAQAGNPRPRLFRLTEDEGVINRLGFNNAGWAPFAFNLTRRKREGRTGIVGANIGANKDSEDRAADYVKLLHGLWGLSDYFTVNISSPNTPGLRGLQTKAALDDLLGRLAEKRATLEGHYPVFLKVAPDLEDDEIEAMVESVLTHGIDAIIAGNTTITRPALKSGFAAETGGLSGAPLMPLATRTLARFHAASKGRVPLIGAGGIASGADALAKIRAGASAVQLYSAMVYGGPGLVTRIKTDLAALLRAEGFKSVAEAVGTAKS
jgi:dihydroorotate dehydrogenase